MAAELNYIAKVDTSQVQSSAVEVSSAYQMALSRGVQGAGVQSGLNGFSNALGGAASGFSMMAADMGGMNPMQVGGMFTPMMGGTFTNPAMAYTPHWGMQQSETSLQQEWMVHRYGLQAAQRMKPPGVGAGEFGMAVERNYIDRKFEAEHQAFAAARSAVVSTVAGQTAWEAMTIAGAAIGGVPGAVVGFGGGYLADKLVGEKFQEHYAAKERERGITLELGETVAGGLGVSGAMKSAYGSAAVAAAKELGMDVNQMNDIVAGARQQGILPTSITGGGSVEKVKADLIGLARAVEEGAEALHASTGKAMAMMKGMGSMGFSDPIGTLSKMGAASGLGAEAMYNIGMGGAGVARQNEISGRVGFDLFTGGVIAAAGSGTSREHLSMMGGVAGAGQMIAQTQMGAALGGIGRMQMMAAMTGQPLSGDLAAVAGQSLQGLTASGGGDPIAGYLRFQQNAPDLYGKVGAAGMRTLAKSQMEFYAGQIEAMSPNLSHNEAMIAAGIKFLHLTPRQARTYVGGTTHAGGGGGGGGSSSHWEAEAGLANMKQDHALSAMASMTGAPRPLFPGAQSTMEMVGGMFSGMPMFQQAMWGGAAGTGLALAATAVGATAGAPLFFGGLAVGAGLGAWHGYGKGREDDEATKAQFTKQERAAYDSMGSDEARENMIEGKKIDLARKAASGKLGKVDLTGMGDYYRRASTGNFDSVALDLNKAGYGIYSEYTGSALALAGVTPVAHGGNGTIAIGNHFFKTADLAQMGKLAGHAKINSAMRGEADAAAVDVVHDGTKASAWSAAFVHLSEAIKHGEAGYDSTEGAMREVDPLLPGHLRGGLGAKTRYFIERMAQAASGGGEYKTLPTGALGADVRGYATIAASLKAQEPGQQAAVSSALVGAFASNSGNGRERANVSALTKELVADTRFMVSLREAAGDPDKQAARMGSPAAVHLEREIKAHAGRYGVDPKALTQHFLSVVEQGKQLQGAAGEGGQVSPVLEALKFVDIQKQTKGIQEHVKGKATGSGGGTAHGGSGEQAVGFGMQESVMSSIDRSLRATASRLEHIERGSKSKGGGILNPPKGAHR